MAFKTDTTLDQSQKARVMLFLGRHQLPVACGRLEKTDSGFSFVTHFACLFSEVINGNLK